MVKDDAAGWGLRRFRLLSVLVGALTLAVGIGPATWAHHFSAYYADSANHTCYIHSESSWTSSQKTGITHAMATVLDGSTDMVDTRYASTSSVVDIKFMRGSPDATSRNSDQIGHINAKY